MADTTSAMEVEYKPGAGSPLMRVPSPVYRWLMEQQQPRETLGQTLRRILEPTMNAAAQNGTQEPQA